jgi:two-component system NtrC family response regulator
MPLLLQAKLLRFLQDRVIERIGGREEILVNVRVVCATNQDPKNLIAQQRFREDLYFRIGEVVVTIPPLRNRIGGPTVLAHAMFAKHSAGVAKGKRGFTPEALAALESYQWPGNVRELENKVKTALIMADGPLLTPEDLGLMDTVAGESVFNLRQVRSRAERQAIVSALAVAEGNMSKCAELLGISRPTLYDLMEKNDLRIAE